MLVRFDMALVGHLFKPNTDTPPEEPPEHVMIMTESGPTKMPYQKKRAMDSTLDIELAVSEMPDWLKEELTKSQLISMDKSDYISLPASVREFAEALN